MKTSTKKDSVSALAGIIVNGLLKAGSLTLTLELLARHSPDFIKELRELMLKHSPNPITTEHIKNLFK